MNSEKLKKAEKDFKLKNEINFEEDILKNNQILDFVYREIYDLNLNIHYLKQVFENMYDNI